MKCKQLCPEFELLSSYPKIITVTPPASMEKKIKEEEVVY